MISRISFIKTLAVVITIGGLSVGCGPNVEMIKGEAQEKAQASFDTKKAELNSAKDMLEQQLDDKKSQLSEKDNIIMQLEKGIAEMSGSETTE